MDIVVGSGASAILESPEDLAMSSPLPEAAEAGAEQNCLLSDHLHLFPTFSLYRPAALSKVGVRGLMELAREPLRGGRPSNVNV